MTTFTAADLTRFENAWRSYNDVLGLYGTSAADIEDNLLYGAHEAPKSQRVSVAAQVERVRAALAELLAADANMREHGAEMTMNAAEIETSERRLARIEKVAATLK